MALANQSISTFISATWYFAREEGRKISIQFRFLTGCVLLKTSLGLLRNYKRARSLIQEKKNIYRDIIFTPSFYYECNEESGKNLEILCKILLGFFASIEQYTK